MRVAGSISMVLWMMTGCGEAPTGATFRPLMEASDEVPLDATRITPERADRVAAVDLSGLPPLEVSSVEDVVSYVVAATGVAFLPDTRLARVGMGGQGTTCVLHSTHSGPAPDVDYPGSDDAIIDVLHGTTDLGTLVGTDFGAWVELNQVGGGEEVDLGGAADALLVDAGVVRLSYTPRGCELSTATGQAHALDVSACDGDPVLAANPRTGVVYTVASGELVRVDGEQLVWMGLGARDAVWDPVGAHLLVLDSSGDVFALDADDAERWRVNIPGAERVGGLGAAAGVTVVTAAGIQLLDAVDGTTVWQEDRADLLEVVAGWGGERLALLSPDSVDFVQVVATR